MNIELFPDTNPLKFNAASGLRRALIAQCQQDQARQRFFQRHTNIHRYVNAAKAYSALTVSFIATRLLQVLATRLLSIAIVGL